MGSGRRNYVKEEMFSRLDRSERPSNSTAEAMRQRKREEEEWNSLPDPEDEYRQALRAQRHAAQEGRAKRPVRTPWGEPPRPRKKKSKGSK